VNSTADGSHFSVLLRMLLRFFAAFFPILTMFCYTQLSNHKSVFYFVAAFIVDQEVILPSTLI
jgi:hypothetical protein